jgi:5'-nucleotidase
MRLLTALATSSLLSSGSALAAPLTIIHVNDTHSHLDAIGPKDRRLDGTLGGLVKAATVIAELKATEPNALLVHGGDLFQGDIYFNTTFGVAEWQLLTSLGLDAAAVGNHELHLGPEALAGALSRAFAAGGSPLLSANLELTGYPALKSWIRPNSLQQVGGVKVGFFGLTTPFDPAASPAPVEILGSDVPALLGIAAEQAKVLREQGAAVVICLSHLGLDLDQFMAASVPGIDVIVGAHDHQVLSQPVVVSAPNGSQVPIVQAGAFYQYVGKLSLSVDTGHVTGTSVYPVNAAVARAPAAESAIEALRADATARYGDLFHRPLAFALADVTRHANAYGQWRDSGIGNLLTDALRWRTRTDLSLTVNGLIPEGLARGWVVGDDVFRTVGDGFDPETGLGFRLFTANIAGSELVRALETTLDVVRESGSDDLFVQASGMRYSFDLTRPAGQRVTKTWVDDCPLDPARKYSVTLNQGLLMGLPMLGVNVTEIVDACDNEFLAVRDYVSHLGLIAYRPQGRVRDVSVPR